MAQHESVPAETKAQKTESLITPPVEMNALLWLLLLGIPGMFWFLVLQKFSL
jgi:hypothetical protein